SCTVHSSWYTETCHFSCLQGQILTVSATSSSSVGFNAKGSAACGGATAACTAAAGSTCGPAPSSKPTDQADDNGTCTVDVGPGAGDATCTAGGGSGSSGCIKTPVACIPCVLQCGGPPPP